MSRILAELHEHQRQTSRTVDYLDGTPAPLGEIRARLHRADLARRLRRDEPVREDPVTWADVLEVAFREVLACDGHADLRNALRELAIVSTDWVNALDRRKVIERRLGLGA